MSDSDIITRCPQCNTAFRVTHNQLAVADGVVRCGSCLAVFKAVDNQTQQAQTEGDDADTEIPEDKLIADEEEVGLELDDDIYDLDTDNKNKKTSLFDRKLQPISQHTRESADESWALDMLADLEDDEIEPIQVKRRSVPNVEPEVQTPIKQTVTAPSKENTRSMTPAEPRVDQTALTPKKSGFSFFKKRSAAGIDKANNPASDIDDEILNFKFEEQAKDGLSKDKQVTLSDAHDLDDSLDDPLEYTQPEASNHPQNDLAHPRKDKDSSRDVDEDLEELYFDQDEYKESISDHSPSKKEKLMTRGIFADNEHAPISDEAIEDAMHSSISYASERKGYISGIQPAPVEMEWYESSRTQRWLWFLGAIILGLVLALQIATFRFNELSKNPNYRPYYQSACKLIGCQLPKLIATEKIRATNLVVRTHPNVEAALVVDAILVNNASFSQPYPALRLEFSDINNLLLASRDLQPADYLRGELAGATQMPSQQPIQLSLAINDPGQNAVNYQLKVISARP